MEQINFFHSSSAKLNIEAEALTKVEFYVNIKDRCINFDILYKINMLLYMIYIYIYKLVCLLANILGKLNLEIGI